MTKNIKLLLLASLSFMACDNLGDETAESSGYNTSDGNAPTAGTADFSKYVALGDSFAAGYSDGALFIEGQKGAYTNLLAQQFATVGGGDFNTPFMNDNFGGFSLSGSQIATFPPRMYFNTLTNKPAILTDLSTTDITAHLSGSFNNFGIPGAKCIHLDYVGYAAANPYFGRMASSTSATVLGDAISQDPTFFSLWIGGNDELSYATSGGAPELDQLTPPAAFDVKYNSFISQLTANGAKGVIANLPNVTTLPYFHVIQYNQLTQADLTVNGTNMVNYLNTNLYGPLSAALTVLGQGDRISLLSTTGNNPMLMVDETLTPVGTSLTAVLTAGGLDTATATALGQVFSQARQTKATDLICLKASTRIGQVPNVTIDGIASPSPLLSQLGVTFPLPDRYVLIPTEVTEIQTATDAYNVTIQNAATNNNLAFVDAKSFMNQLTSSAGYTANGYTLTNTYVTGGAFSLDGIHPSPRGYALIANLFSQAINAKYGSNFGNLNLGNYRILFPQSL